MDDDRNGDLGAKALIIDNALGCIVEIIAAKNCLDTYSKGVISMALKLVHKCSDEAAGRTKAAYAGIVPALLRLLADMSHIRKDTPADNKLMEDIASALAAVATVDSKKVILEGDIPEGSEAAIRLLRSNNLKKILDMVSYDARSTTYMQCLTKCFANISQLEEGVTRMRDAGAIAAMLPLLQKPVLDVKENALFVIRNLVKRDAKARTEFFDADAAQVLAPFLAPQHQKHVKIMEHTLHIFGDLLFRGKPAETQKFEDNMKELNMFEILAACMGKDLPRATRDLTEEVIRIALDANKKDGKEHELDDKPWIKDPLKEHAIAISKRKKADQEEQRRRVQEAQKQEQMMQMMAMQQMMGGGEPGMEEMMSMMGGMGGMGYGDM
mmetsp:Transcript_69483/g.115817  ORF Transcript_69483/g.115817 Transcript_69483/m.115817 type:complete len:382 (+) Transcript_69483:228-1373(+)